MAVPELSGVPVLVTGGAGFIGSHLVDALVELGASVRVFDNLATGRSENLDRSRDRVQWVEGDLRDFGAVESAARDRRIVFHQAALGSVPRSMEDPATSFEVNVQGTANLFHACRDAGVARIVFASSSSVYGDSDRLPKREGEEGEPLSPYALTKWMNEEIARNFHRAFGLESVGLRYFNVYGPRQRPDGPYAAVIPRFFAAALEGRSPVIYGDGAQSRDFTFVGDAVRANLLAAGAAPPRCPCDGRGTNVAAGRRTTVAELAARICSVSGASVTPAHEDPRPGDVRHSLADLGQTGDWLGYAPATDLEAGLAASLAHYRSTVG